MKATILALFISLNLGYAHATVSLFEEVETMLTKWEGYNPKLMPKSEILKIAAELVKLYPDRGDEIYTAIVEIYKHEKNPLTKHEKEELKLFIKCAPKPIGGGKEVIEADYSSKGGKNIVEPPKESPNPLDIFIHIDPVPPIIFPPVSTPETKSHK